MFALGFMQGLLLKALLTALMPTLIAGAMTIILLCQPKVLEVNSRIADILLIARKKPQDPAR